MSGILVLLSGVIAIIAALPYIIDTFKGRTKPNVVTWFTWTLMNVITVVATLADGAYQTAVFAAVIGTCTAVIAILGLKHGLKRYTALDALCQVLAIIGIVLWQATDNPGLAVLMVILSSFIATVPTYRHAWKAPHEETWSYYALDAFAALLIVSSILQPTFTSLGYPAYILLSDASLAAIILYRLPRNKRKK